MREVLGWLSAMVLPPLAYWVSHQQGLSLQASIFVGIMVAVVLMWVFNLVDEYIPPLMGMSAALFFNLAPPSIALSGMASPSLLTLMGVFALAMIIASSGLSRRLVLYLMLKLPDRFVLQQNVLLFCGLLLSLVSPSGNSRATLLLPLFKEVSGALGLAQRGVAITSLIAATYGGAMLFSTALSNSKSASIAAVSMLPAHQQTHYLGLFWIAAACVPMLVLLLFHLVSIRMMFAQRPTTPLAKEVIAQKLQALGRLSSQERMATVAFAFFFLGSLTTGLHHLDVPKIAGLTLLLILLMGALKKADFRSAMDWPMIFFLLGMDSMMRTMRYLGLDRELARFVGNLFGFVDGSFAFFALATLVTTVALRLILPVAAGMLLSFLIMLPVAVDQGYSPWVCVFLTAIFSDIWFFRHQSAAYLVILNSDAGLSYDHAGFMRHNMIMNAARVLCVFAAIPWWQSMGLI
jgi:DASS family divalent anion:Na+ symporter